MMDVGESEFCFSGCEICERKGYVDYILNATKSAKEEDYWPEDYFIPLESSKLPILEISSIMFYLMCNDNDYSDLEFNFERPDKNNSKIKNVSEFVEYFIDYKKNREERKEFIKKYFKELKDKLIKNTMVSKYEQNQCLYFECDCLPFDIVHKNSVNEIQLKVCSICYDVGFNSDRNSHIFEYYYYATLINPDYSDRDKMFDSLLETVHKYRKYFESLRG